MEAVFHIVASSFVENKWRRQQNIFKGESKNANDHDLVSLFTLVQLHKYKLTERP